MIRYGGQNGGALAGLLRKEAGFRIHDAESAIALLRTAFDIREFSSNDRDCVEHLAAVAAEDPESLTALMADPQLRIHRESIPIIIGKVTDPALLLKLECASYGVVSNRAGEAREKLAATRQLSVPEFEWQIGGETYIHALISLLNNVNAPDTAKIAAKHIGEIYRTVPGSRDALSHVRGKNYSLHYDYDEQTCGIHHVDRRETLTTDW